VNTGRGPLVGREHDLEALAGLLARAAAGSGGLVLVTGEPGIGKTRLLEEAAARATGAGFAVAWGRAYEVGGAPTYWPWIEALRGLLARPGAGDAQGAAAGELALLLPELGGPGAARSEVDRFRLFDALTAALRAAAEREPVLLVLDDLHAADPSSLQLAELVAHHLGRMRVALLASHRDLEARLSPAIDAGLGRLGRLGEVLVLSRLDRAAVEELVGDAIGRRDAEAARMIHDATDGNPLFVREVLRLLDSRGASARAGVPAGVRAVIRERLALLAPATVSLLQAAAVVGREFTVALAAEVAGVTAEALEEAACEALAAELLERAGPGRLRFSHALVAETLAADLSPALRMRHHRRAAEALARRHAGDPAPPLDEIAHHWLEAGADAAAQAAVAAERAARAASARLAFADAAALLARAVEALASAAPADATRRADLLVAQVEAHARAGERARSEEVCSAAAELCREIGDGVRLAGAALALGAEVTTGKPDPPLIRLLGEALERLPPGDGALRARVLARLAAARQPEMDPSGPIVQAREAIAMASRLADPAVTLQVLHAAMGAMTDYAPPAERAALNGEAARLAAAARDRPRGLRALLRLVFDRIEMGDVAGFEAALSDYQALADEVRQPRHLWVTPMFRSMRALWEGRFADADRLEAEATELRERAGIPASPWAETRLLSRAILREDPAGLDRLVARADIFVGDDPRGQRAFRAMIHARCGRPGEARKELAGLDPRAIPPAVNIHILDVVADLVWGLREPALADALYPQALPLAGRLFVVSGIGFDLHGVVDHSLMRLAAVLRRWDDVDRHGEAALAMCARLGARPIAAAVRADRAETLLARGDAASAARARVLVAAALEAAEQMAMPGLVGRCRELEARLDAAGGREAGAAPRTAREAPAAALVVDAAAVGSPAVRLVREGEYWTVSGPGEVCRVRDSRGVRMLAQLIDAPGIEHHVLDLSGAHEPVDGGDAGEPVDRAARAAYAERLLELRSEIEQAEAWNDAGRRARLAAEQQAITAELAGAYGLGGRPRRSGAAVERARTNVRRRIADALRRIEDACPRLGRQLSRDVRTGIYCAYEPEPR